MATPLAIIAGQGSLPVYLARAAALQGRAVILAEMEGHPAQNPDSLPVFAYRVEKLGALFKALRKFGAQEVVFAGGVPRPKLDPVKFDLKTMSLAPKFLPALRSGDDGLLRTVLGIFESEGFAVRAAHEVVGDLLPAQGVLTRHQPGPVDKKDAARAMQIVAALSEADVGQGAIVAQGVVLAVEATPGTDEMLDYVAQSAGRWRPDASGQGGVLFKGPKRGQDLRVDLPAIGPDTVTRAQKAGLAGIVIEAGGVMVLDRKDVVDRANDAGLFVWVTPIEAGT